MPNEESNKPEEQVSEDALYEEYSEESEAPVKKKKGKRGVLSTIIFIVCAAVFVYSMYHIVIEQFANRDTDKTVDRFQQERLEYEESLKNGDEGVDEGNDVGSSDETQSPETPSTTPVTDDRVARPVFDKTGNSNIKFLAADLSPYIAINADTVGWFMFSDVKNKDSGLPIDLPIVYSGDNEYYLDHNFYNEENINGWVFVDYRNDAVNLSENYNTILYGHARSDNMFGGLKYLNTEKTWYNNKDNHYIYVKTKNQDTVWQIFSWYETSVADETSSNYNYIRTSFSNPETFVEFCNQKQDKNAIDAFAKLEFTEDDRIMTLSTCKSYDKDIRVVVHAKLVKLQVWE
jgi:SrtB family sortase